MVIDSLTIPIPMKHLCLRAALDGQGGNEIGLGGKPAHLAGMGGP